MKYKVDPRTGELWWKRDDGTVCRGVLGNIRETPLKHIPFATLLPVENTVAEIRQAVEEIRESAKGFSGAYQMLIVIDMIIEVLGRAAKGELPKVKE